MKVISKPFDVEVQPFEMSIPVVIGGDLIAEASDQSSENQNKPVHERFYTSMNGGASAHQRAKAKTVLVIGSYSELGIQRMRRIENFLIQLGYEPVLLVDYPSGRRSVGSEVVEVRNNVTICGL
jgi:hypothetical protein